MDQKGSLHEGYCWLQENVNFILKGQGNIDEPKGEGEPKGDPSQKVSRKRIQARR
jgi:hypothetical protein